MADPSLNEMDIIADHQRHGGRPPTLDDAKRRKILALLANGSSRRVAARVAGCSHSTIARTAMRDPEFAAELDAAEHNSEIEALRQVRKAAKKDRYWRAAAWLLERRNPRDFARRTPTTLSEEDAANLAMRMADPIIYKMSDEEFDEFQDRLYGIVCALYKSNELARLLPIPPPPPPVYVARDNDGPKPQGFAPGIPDQDDRPEEDRDCPNSAASESETDPFLAPSHRENVSRQSPSSPSTDERLPKGSAPRSQKEDDEPEVNPSPKPVAIAPLPTIPIATSEVAV